MEGLSLRLLLSDPSAKGLAKEKRLQEVTVATIGHPDSRLLNVPPARGIEDLVEARLNNALLGSPISDGGWLVFDRLSSDLFAVGPNLVGLRLTQPRPKTAESILIEKLEVEVRYRQP